MSESAVNAHRVLVLGSGGREHALVWACTRSDSCTSVAAAPGNPGIARIPGVVCIDLDPSDGDSVVAAAQMIGVDLIIVGPEAPLAAGVADELRAAGYAVFGPDRDAAQLESSKAFAKQFMRDAGIPTARSHVATSLDEATAAIDDLTRDGVPPVIKADGLAAGKGVVVPTTREEAIDAAALMLDGVACGTAGSQLVVEECLVGREASVIGVVSDDAIELLAAARDHKRAFDGDRGPNTGGMGAYSPVDDVDDQTMERVRSEVFEPAVRELARRGLSYRGALYAGLMLTDTGPQVIEFNVRFGDPEAEVILPRLRSDFVQLCHRAATGRLHEQPPLLWDERHCVGIVVAADGYPQAPRTGMPVTTESLARDNDDGMLFLAGTKHGTSDTLVVSGGRVACAIGLGDSRDQAREVAESVASSIAFDGAWHRHDIGCYSAAGTGDGRPRSAYISTTPAANSAAASR